MATLTTELAEILRTVQRPGDFYTTGTIDIFAPRLDVVRIPRISATQSTGRLPPNPYEAGSWPLLVIVENEVTDTAHVQHVQEAECLVQAIVSDAYPTSAATVPLSRMPQRCWGTDGSRPTPHHRPHELTRPLRGSVPAPFGLPPGPVSLGAQGGSAGSRDRGALGQKFAVSAS
jgi:hypothetical protein